MQLSDNMPYYLWYMTAYVAHTGVLLCGRPELAPKQKEAEEHLAEKDRDLLAEQKDE